jgi:polyphenol oxidase
MMAPLLRPDWPVPAHVRSACSLRTGGVSLAPYDSLNLGDHVGDDAGHVTRNREVYAQALGAKPVYLKQVHGTDCISLDAQTPDGAIADAWLIVCQCCLRIARWQLWARRMRVGVGCVAKRG